MNLNKSRTSRTFRTFRTIVLWLFIILLTGCIVSWVLIERLISGPGVKEKIESSISSSLGVPLTIDNLQWNGWPSWILTAHDVRLWENENKKHLIAEAPMVEIHLRLLSFYSMALAIKEVKFIRPHCYFRRNLRHELNIEPIIESITETRPRPKRRVGRIVLEDFSIQDGLVSVQTSTSATMMKLPITLQGEGQWTSVDATIQGILKSSTTSANLKLKLEADPSLKITLDASDFTYRTTVIPSFRAVIRQRGKSYVVEPTEFKALGGTIQAQGSYTPSFSTNSVQLAWKTTGVQAQDIFRLAGSPTEVSGTLDSEGQIQTATGQEILSNINGQVKIDLKDGWFGNAQGLLKVLTRINLATLVTEVEGEHQSRVPFKETQGVLNISNGIVSTVDPFTLENKTLQLKFNGHYNLMTKNIDGKVVVNVLMITDEIINKIPLVRDILLGDGKGLTPIWLSVSGPARDPKIKVLSGKSMISPIWNTLQRTFRLPGKLIHKMKD